MSAARRRTGEREGAADRPDGELMQSSCMGKEIVKLFGQISFRWGRPPLLSLLGPKAYLGRSAGFSDGLFL